MTAVWDLPDFDAHEGVHLITDEASGLRAVIAIHSTHRGPGAGGTRFWHYADPTAAITDALRLSRGMSFKNAMADLPMGGAKGVILTDAARTKTPAMLAAFGRAIDRLGGAYVTAEDVGMSVADMVAIREQTRHVSGLPSDAGDAGGDPGPFTAQGVYLGIRAAAKHRLGTDDMADVRVAIQGIGSVGGGVARRLAADGAKLIIADIDAARAQALAAELGADVADPAHVLFSDVDIVSPNALGGVLSADSIGRIRAPIIAGGANNQLATAEDGQRVHDAGKTYAPDYVINAGGIINVALEYLAQQPGGETTSREAVEARIAHIPARLTEIWETSAADNRPASAVADAMAQRLIGR